MDAEFFQGGQLVIAGAPLLVSGAGLAALCIGLGRMKEAGARRAREMDAMAGAFSKPGEAMPPAFTQPGPALERPGEVLAALLRRPASPRPIPRRAGSGPAPPCPDGPARLRAGRFARSPRAILFPSTPPWRHDREVAGRRAVDVGRSSCSGGRGPVILMLSNKRKSPLQERASLYPEPWTRRGMEAVKGVTACPNYITRQRLRQGHSAPSLFRTE